MRPNVIVGMGYAGQMAALRLRRGLPQVPLVVVDPRDRFVQRVQLHQLAAGQAIPAPAIGAMADALGARWVQDRAVGLDAGRRVLRLASGAVLPYDQLLVTLGSRSRPCGTAVTLDAPDTVRALARRLTPGRSVAVLGAGFTGVELAAELAEAPRPVALFGPLLPGLSDAARRHARAHLEALGVRLDPRRVQPVDGGVQVGTCHERFDEVVACTGFQAPAFARDADLPVDALGRARVDATLQCRPGVWFAGDAARVERPDGSPYRMACAVAMPMGAHAADNLVRQARGQDPRPFDLGQPLQCLSLGRREALVQPTTLDDRPRQDRVWTGLRARALKEFLVRMVVGLPQAERRLGRPLYAWPTLGAEAAWAEAS